MTTCLMIWKAPCKMAFKQRRPNAIATVGEVTKVMREMTVLESQGRTSAPRDGEQSRVPRAKENWQKSMPLVITINVDAAWNATTRQGGVGIVARDHTRALCGGRHRPLVGEFVEEMEAIVVVEGVSLAVEMGWPCVRVESKSETIINHLLSVSFSWRIEAILSHVCVLVSSLSTVR